MSEPIQIISGVILLIVSVFLLYSKKGTVLSVIIALVLFSVGLVLLLINLFTLGERILLG